LRVLQDRTAAMAELRDCGQHQIGEIDRLTSSREQIWGYISCAEVRDGQHTGRWLMMAAGADYAGSGFWFIGPAVPPFPVPVGHIRLHAFGKQVYLGRVAAAIADATTTLAQELRDGKVRAVGPSATERRGADFAAMGVIEVLMSAPSGSRPLPNIATPA